MKPINFYIKPLLLAICGLMLLDAQPTIGQECLPQTAAVIHSAGGYFRNTQGAIVGQGWLGSPVAGLFPVPIDADANGISDICENIINIANVGDPIPRPAVADQLDPQGKKIPPLWINIGGQQLSLQDQTKVFWHQQAGENNAGELFASEKGVVTVGWKLGNGNVRQTYNILDDKGTVNFFISVGTNNDGPPVNVSNWYNPAKPKNIVFRYNSIIKNATDARVEVIGNITQFMAEKAGTFIVEFNDLSGNLIALEVIRILNPFGTERVYSSTVPVGKKYMPTLEESIEPTGTDSPCKPIVTKGINQQDDSLSFAFQQEENGPTKWNVYPIRPTQGNPVIVYWYKLGVEDVCWPTERDIYEAVWPTDPQVNVRAPGQHPKIDMTFYNRAEIKYQQPLHAAIEASLFFTQQPGMSTVMYTKTDLIAGTEVFFEVVQTVDHLTLLTNTDWNIGLRITDADHQSVCFDSGFIYQGTNYDPSIYKFQKGEESAIFAVNAGDLEVWWYKSSQQVCWPVKPVRYHCIWPATPDHCIIIANEKGVGPFSATKYKEPLIYELGNIGDNPATIGFNPNEEHAEWITNPGDSIYAARDDLNGVYNLSEPYVLLRYRDGLSAQNSFGKFPWEFDVIRVAREVKGAPVGGCPCTEGPCEFVYSTIAGMTLRPPAPLVFHVPYCQQNRIITQPPEDYIWDDNRGNLWYRRGDVQVIAEYFENWRGEGCDPWLDDGTRNPQDVTWVVNWPSIPSSIQNPPGSSKDVFTTMAYGQTRDRSGFRIAEILYNEANAVLIMPYKTSFVPLNFQDFPDDYLAFFAKLDPHLQARLAYDEVNGLLSFKGVPSQKLLGIMSVNDRDAILKVFDQSHHSAFRSAINNLYTATQQEGASQVGYILEPESPDWGIALASGSATKQGWVVLGYNGRLDITDPADVEVFYVGCPPFQGEIYAIPPECPFEEKITLRWSGDCGGDCKEFEFYWQIAAGDNPNDFDDVDPDANPNGPPAFSPWEDYVDPERNFATGWVKNQSEIVIKGANIRTLTDNWVRVKYRVPPNANPSLFACAPGTESEWTAPQLAEGWMKRVKRGINPFDQRIKNFTDTRVATYVSMIQQLGRPYLDRVALTCRADILNSLGLIELYQAVLFRGKSFTVDQGLNYPPANQALMLMAGNLADFQMLLGNEALSDALDPTIAIDLDQNEFATSIFSFQDQLPSNQNSLIYEELALLRGRDDRGTPIDRFPVYNRLYHNFTLGDGQVAYKNNYDIVDKDNNGSIDALDAAIMFPQGHGDAWGHFLTAIKFYYDLLRHPSFDWQVREEAVLVNQVPVQVSYAHERKFARAASAKARVGAELVNLVYREQYSEDPSIQWQGYKDTVEGRHWGVSEWARRSYMGAYFDWATANANLPALDDDPSHQGSLKKVDRTTVPDLRVIATEAQSIQDQLDQADAGLNPLGLAKNVVPFDIVPPPAPPAEGKSHFEQVYDRSVIVLNNAISVFNHANKSANSLRRNQDQESKFENNVEDQEADFNSRLIEIFGYPYPEDKNPVTGFLYGPNFVGPDLYHWAYINIEDLIGVNLPQGQKFNVSFKVPEVDPDTGVVYDIETQPVEFNVVPGFGLVKPREFTLERKAPGEIQLARSDLIQTWWRMEGALAEYDNMIKEIEDQSDLLRAHYNLTSREISILTENKNTQESLNKSIINARKKQLEYRDFSNLAIKASEAAAEYLPKLFVAGLASGGDFTSVARGAILVAGKVASGILAKKAQDEAFAEMEFSFDKEIQNSITQIKLTTLRSEYQNHVEMKKLEQMIRNLNAKEIEIFTIQETIRQASGRYQAAIQRGLRLLDDRTRFRQQTAEQVSNFRYKDMAFRIFRNDALQKYRAQFDLAARYALLAAKAYGYETNLIHSDTKSGEQLLARIVRERSLGYINNGIPETGQGLAGVMAELNNNYQSIKSLLGFNTPRLSTNKFSLRRELFRIKPGLEGNQTWRETLQRSVVRDLRSEVPEFERLVSFDPYNAPEPAIVIDFGTVIQSDTNFFGWLSTTGGESFFPSDHFSIKIRSVGAWFSNYNDGAQGLTTTPRMYLAPVGADVMRIPFSGGKIREWFVVDQLLPLPNRLGESDYVPRLNNWLPVNQLRDIFLKPNTRRYASIPVFHDSGGSGSITPDRNQFTANTYLVGRSVWNTRWVLIIPGRFLLPGDPTEGIRRFIQGSDGTGGVTDIRLAFETYEYASAG